MSTGSDALGGAIVFIFLALIVALVLREVWCWYWKINKVVALLESIDSSLKLLPGVARGREI